MSRVTHRIILTAAVLIICQPLAHSQEAVRSDTLLKLAVFKPHTLVYDNPKGKIIGHIDRGRVIRLLGSEGMWLHFTTWDFNSGWLRWENTVTLDEWANSPRFDSLQTIIIAWERAVKALDEGIDESLAIIQSYRDGISAGEISLSAGIAGIERESVVIENSFRELHQVERTAVLEDAVKALDGKRWALSNGLQYLVEYLREGDEESGTNASNYFDTAENFVYEYTRIIFRLKSTYDLYDEAPEVNNEKQ
ncbi:MAG: hypothetical protein HQ591_09455 [candidate division Zixibacteria bacterium]|nr:hypothetical protein [Candidatus Tariuqbacter arcticus]